MQKGYPLGDNLFLMTIQVLNGTILIEFNTYYRDFYIVKGLYCETDIFMHCWSVNVEICAFTSICKKSSYS